MFCFTKGVLDYFLLVIDDDEVVMDQFAMENVLRLNKAALSLYHALLVCIYWLCLKQAVREFKIDEVDKLMPSLWGLCLATGHTNVADQILRWMWYKQTMIPAVLAAHHKAAICALSNGPARGVGINLPTERFNLYINQACKQLTDINTVKEEAVTFNATLPVERDVKEMFGFHIHGDTHATCFGSPTKILCLVILVGEDESMNWESNILINSKAIVDLLKEELGETRARLCAYRPTNTFATQPPRTRSGNTGDPLDTMLSALNGMDWMSKIQHFIHEYDVLLQP